ncbi:curli-like amyloid fiber formation chaperone CsgH [Chelativorans sp. YIM 93263]|uniref:curli-like amyloid fiber formation chaperone CsgH n=1 Tax=Chelativorans sp. YIM 93263 TaxID=2906648 RepID=UPI002377F22E|nr:curli-like amyloid fiber formation chaperone CsgH [Chelativorans sp. YIM 93263]
MLRKTRHIAPAAAGIALAVSATALMAGSGSAHSDTARCEVLVTSAGGSTTLEGVVHAERPMSGSYTFRVESSGASGSSNIKQGGDFSASPGHPAKLGRVMLGGSGSVFDATLEIETPGGRLECTKRAGAI